MNFVCTLNCVLIFCFAATESSPTRHDLTSSKELQTLHAELDSLKTDLALRMELTSELEVQVENLEKKVHAAEEKEQASAYKMKMALEDKKGLADQVREDGCRMLPTNEFIDVVITSSLNYYLY